MKPLNYDIVFFLHAITGQRRKKFDSDWDGCYPVNRIMETIHSKLDYGSKVLCVERPVCIFTTPLLHYSKFKRWMLGRNIFRNITHNFFVYLPYTFLQDSVPVDYRYFTSINRKLLGRQLMRVLSRCNFESRRRIVWVYHPFQVNSLGLVNEDIVVYQCFDEFSAPYLSIPKSRRDRVKRLEIKLLKKADIVFATSDLLVKNKRKYNSRCFYIPNGADVDYFRKVQDPGIEQSARLKRIRRPIIGYLGSIDHLTNIELLTYAAVKKPEWSFVIIGPIVEEKIVKTTTYNRFKNLPNVHLFGYIYSDELISILKGFDVGVIPYKVDSEYNQNVNPTKLHEYCAMGKPVVSTNLPEVASYKDIIYIAHNDDDFIDLIRKAIQEDNPERIERRLKVAKKNSWDERVEEMIGYIEDVLTKRS